MMRCGNRVVLVQATQVADLGDEGYISSIKSNGWIKVKICKTRKIISIQNNPQKIVLYSQFAENARQIMREFYN